MATVTFILGLCGSGKTWLADRIVAVDKFDESFKDDPARHDALFDSLRNGNDCVVSEIAYCRKADRDAFLAKLKAAVPGVMVNWLCIEKDLFRANKNCQERTNKADPAGHIAMNNSYYRDYSYPDGAVILKMWTRE